MKGSGLDAQGLAIVCSGLGAIALGCGAVGLLQWKLKLRWPAAYLLWTVYVFIACNVGAYVVDARRYAPSRFWASFLEPLPFSIIVMTVIWLALRQARVRVDRAYTSARRGGPQF